MLTVKIEITNDKEVRTLVNNRLEFSTKPVEVFNEETGLKSITNQSIYEQIYYHYVTLKCKTIKEDLIEELCETIETSENTKEIKEALDKLSKEI